MPIIDQDEQALKRAARLLRVHVRTKEGDDLAARLEALAAPADSTAPPTKDEFDAGERVLTCPSCHFVYRIWAAALAAPAPPLSAQPAEPVAWMIQRHTDKGTTLTALAFTIDEARRALPEGTETPLYAAPPAAEQQKKQTED